MTEIEIRNFSVKVKGHANFDEKGKDIVCSAVSALFYTLYETLSILKEDGMLESLDGNIDEGEASIECKPKTEFIGNVSMAFLTVSVGLNLIADNYKENVKVTMIE